METLVNEGIENAYFNAFPLELTQDLVRLIAEQAKTAKSECDTFYPRAQATDLYPDVRRAKIEAKVQVIIEDYEDVKAIVRSKNRTGKSNFHTELCSGNVLLTIHKVQSERSKVRSAAYCKSLASSSQNILFSESLSAPPDAALYVQLKYGVVPKLPQALAFVILDFPDSDGNIVHSINLLRRASFAQIPSEFFNVSAVENIEDTLDLNFRSDNQAQKDKDGTNK